MKKKDLGARAPNPRPRQRVGQFLRQILDQEVPLKNSPGVTQAKSEGNAAVRPLTQTAGVTPGDPKNVLVEVKAGERVIFRGTAWALVTIELFKTEGPAIGFSGPYKVFANGVEQDEPFEEAF